MCSRAAALLRPTRRVPTSPARSTAILLILSMAALVCFHRGATAFMYTSSAIVVDASSSNSIGCCHETWLTTYSRRDIATTVQQPQPSPRQARQTKFGMDRTCRRIDARTTTRLRASSQEVVDNGGAGDDDENQNNEDDDDSLEMGFEDAARTPKDDNDDAFTTISSSRNTDNKVPAPPSSRAEELRLMQRVMQLEQLVASQQVQIRHLLEQVKELATSAAAFADVVALLREAGLQMQNNSSNNQADSKANPKKGDQKPLLSPKTTTKVTESLLDDVGSSIFGTAPATVMDAADAAGAAILAGILGGKQRMLVDVRDAELSFSPEHSETLVQFIELAILPVAAGLEGLRSQRNRLKVVFPTVSHLLTYRKSMALAAPEVVALSTLGFDPVEKKDNLVVILVPSPDDEEGLMAMNELLESKSLTQPVVVLNHHMIPVSGPAADFEVAYHLRLLSVQYMAGETTALSEQFFKDLDSGDGKIARTTTTSSSRDDDDIILLDEDTVVNATATTATYSEKNSTDIAADALLSRSGDDDVKAKELDERRAAASKGRDAALEAAMKHAQEVGLHHGVTRAMVIRAYPRPWHVFVDTSPDTDADFEVAAIFADEPGLEQVNNAIIECLEGSELEDELVAQQMQQALELGQLDRISEMLSSLGLEDFDDDEDDDDPYSDMFGEDTV